MRGGENVSLFEGHKFDQDLPNREETDSGVCVDIGELLIMIVWEERKRAQRDERAVPFTGEKNRFDASLEGRLHDGLIVLGISVRADNQ